METPKEKRPLSEAVEEYHTIWLEVRQFSTKNVREQNIQSAMLTPLQQQGWSFSHHGVRTTSSRQELRFSLYFERLPDLAEQ